MGYLTAGELMEKLNISRSTLYRWRKDGMPHEKLGHKTIRYDFDEVKEWLRQRGQGSEDIESQNK